MSNSERLIGATTKADPALRLDKEVSHEEMEQVREGGPDPMSGAQLTPLCAFGCSSADSKGVSLKGSRQCCCEDGDELPPRLEFAPDAAVCGALGCRERDDLLRVQDEGGRRRVLCPEHARGWLSR